jgi:ribosomal protein S27E
MSKKTVNCKSCGQIVAKTANKCPHCGATYSFGGAAFIAAIGWILVMLGVLAIVGNPNIFIGGGMIVIGAAMGLGMEALKKHNRGG